MILPTKRIGEDRALITLGGLILSVFDKPTTVSRIWHELQEKLALHKVRVDFDWFVLALDLLFIMDLVCYSEGKISKKKGQLS